VGMLLGFNSAYAREPGEIAAPNVKSKVELWFA